jgi:mono/diheme cytochrome c family protein
MKSMARAALLTAAMLAGTAATGYAADDVTFYENVAPILQANCVSCHRPAGQNIGSLVAPMSLMTYEEARPWARSIALKVKAKEMPPWFADSPKGVFTNERGLTDKQIETIVAWANGGAKAGDKAKAPAPVTFADVENGGYTLGKPDLIVKMPPTWPAATPCTTCAAASSSQARRRSLRRIRATAAKARRASALAASRAALSRSSCPMGSDER